MRYSRRRSIPIRKRCLPATPTAPGRLRASRVLFPHPWHRLQAAALALAAATPRRNAADAPRGSSGRRPDVSSAVGLLTSARGRAHDRGHVREDWVREDWAREKGARENWA